MKTYDDGASTFGTGNPWRALRRMFKRLIDREREIIMLRNAVGMLSEARRVDSGEYHDMARALRRAQDRVRQLEARDLGAFPHLETKG